MGLDKPDGVSAADFARALEQFGNVVGKEWVLTGEDNRNIYRDYYSVLWGEPDERVASGAVAPSSVEQVQSIVRIANQLKIPLYPISTGRNLGYGGSAPNLSGSVVLDLKRMNRVLEVDDQRHFALVEPGVSYFDLYRYIREHKLRVWVDCPDPGWGSPMGNSLDHGVGYTWGHYRDHFFSHCGMEVVLPNGELLRTGMGALPGAKTWQEYRYGYGPYVDGLFSQGSLGVVTKMGFWLMPEPEAYFAGTITAPRRADIIPLVGEMNYLEHIGMVGQPNYGSPLRAVRDAGLQDLLTRNASGEEIDRWAAANNQPYWSVQAQFYGSARGNAADWTYVKERVAAHIPGARFKDGPSYTFPLTDAQAEGVAHKVALGIPNLSAFARGTRTASDAGDNGHVWYAAIIPKTGEAVLEAQGVFADVMRQMGTEQLTGPLSAPSTWMYRTFIMLVGFPLWHDRPEQNRKTRAAYERLVDQCAQHGWGEYRTPPAFQDKVMGAYSFNDHALRRFNEVLKDAVDPNGILSAGRAGVWPRHLRDRRR